MSSRCQLTSIDKLKQARIKYHSSKKGRAYSIRRNAFHRAKKQNVPFDLSIEWVNEHLEKEICEVTKLPLTLITKETYNTQNNSQPFSPSIDRIIPELGYIESNCRIVCFIFNICKFHWTEDDVKTFVKAYYRENGLEQQV